LAGGLGHRTNVVDLALAEERASSWSRRLSADVRLGSEGREVDDREETEVEGKAIHDVLFQCPMLAGVALQSIQMSCI